MVLLAVIAAHLAIIDVAIRAAPTLKFIAWQLGEQITLVYVPPPVATEDRASRDTPTATPSRQRTHKDTAPQNRNPESPLISIPSPEQPPPPIDWEKEAELAAQSAIKPDEYRNLSGMSAEQRKWITDHQFVPEPPGIAWKRPVLDHTPEGMPIIHLGDRCVIMPPLPMVFCKIGKSH